MKYPETLKTEAEYEMAITHLEALMEAKPTAASEEEKDLEV